MTIHLDYDQVETLAGQGLSKKEIAYCLNISEKSIYNKQKNDVQFLQAIKKGRAKGLKKVTNALFQNATKSNNVTAQIFYLKNRAPDKWSDRRQTEITGKDGGPIGILPFEFVDANPEITQED